MGANHHYDLVKQGEGEDDKFEPQIHYPSASVITTSWWTFLLYNLFTAAAGAAMMLLVVRGGWFAPQSSSGSSSSSSSVATVTTTVTASAGLAQVTPSIEHVSTGDVDASNDLAGIILDCGGNPAEARAKGCVFDVMMQDWVPEPCYDSALTEKYLAQGNYTWYKSGDGSVTMSDEEMRKGEHGSAWMSTNYHKDHCVFSWLKIIRALRNNAGISQELISYDHVLHCSHGALKELPDDTNLGVAAPTNYAKCALFNTWFLHPIPDKHDSTSKR